MSAVGQEFAWLRVRRGLMVREVWQLALFARRRRISVGEAIRRLRRAGLWR